jgi:ABC-2 type transport system permease protein
MIDIRKVFEIGRVNLLRQVRDRSDLFFVFVLPTIIIVALGLQFGGAQLVRVGVVAPAGDAAATALVEQIRGDGTTLDIHTIATIDELRNLVERGRLEAGVVIPEGFGAGLSGTGTVTVTYLATTGALTSGVRAPIDAAIAKLAAIATAARVAAGPGGDVAAARPVAESLYDTVPGITIDAKTVGEAGPFAGLSGFSFGASTQLVLFMFLTSMTAASRLVWSRRFGVSRRMVSTPTSMATIVAGEALGRFGVAMVQAAYIVAISSLAFGVSWGDPLAAGALIALFGVVAAGIALLVGALARTPDQASSMGVFVGLAMGALGGSMIPFQIMPPLMQNIARVLPQSWTLLGIQSLIRDGGGIASVAPNLAVLAVWAVGVMALASWRFRKSITG